MLGDTITLELGATEGDEPITLKKINQDGYSAEYRLKESDREHIVLIRHTNEGQRLKGNKVERHNVTYTQNIFPTELKPQGETRQAYSVIRVAPDVPNAEMEPLVRAVMSFTWGNAEAVLNWES